MKVGSKTIQLTDVAYVPGFDVNLMSVAKIVDKNARVIYDKKKATVETEQGQVLFSIPRVHDLYINKEKKEKSDVAVPAADQE